jgi:predicted nucleic acid-binding protein
VEKRGADVSFRLVLDASVVLSWLLPDEQHPRATALRERAAECDLVVPVVWWFELRNAMLAGERRGRITGAQSDDFLQGVAALPVRVDAAAREAALMQLARGHRLSIYDATYLELALREQRPLATLDRALAAAAEAEGVALAR